MAPRPAAASRTAAARGCHAVRNQLSRTPTTTATTRSVSTASAASRPLASPPPSPVWISDTLLARAFARFSRVSHAGRAASATTTGSRRPVHVRLSSSVPGPLEARRRLGKRQMTEQLGLAQHPLPPLPYPFLTAAAGENDGAGGGWGTPVSPSSASAYSLDPRLWQWAPPRDPARRPTEEQRQQTQIQPQSRPWLARMVDALGEQTAAPQNELANAPPQPPQPPRRLPQAPAPLHRSAAARAFFGELDAWRRRSTIASAAVAPPSFAQSLEAICRALETQLRLAALTADEADEALGLLWAGLVQAAAFSASPSSASFLRTHTPVLFTAVLRGVSACRLLPAAAAAADLGAPFWRRLLEGVCTLSASAGTAADCSAADAEDRAALARLAADMLAATPPALLARDLSDLVPAVLEAIFCATAADETRIAAVATALQDVVVVGAEEQDANSSVDDIVAATTSRLLQNWTTRQEQQQQGPSPTPPQVHEATELHAWLRTLAHMPQVRQECLFAALAQAQECVQAARAAPGADCTAEDSATPLLFSDVFLCDLLLAQWASRSYIPQGDVLLAHRQTMRENDGAPSVALAALALAVYRTPACRPRCVALYVSLLTCLRRLGRGEAVLVASVEALMEAAVRRQDAAAASAPPLPLPFLEALAWAADDLPTALRLHALYAVHARRRARANRTDPRLRFLRAMAAADDGGRHEPRAGRRRRNDGWPLWRLAFWNKFADRLGAELDRGALTPGQVSFALDLGERWSGGDRSRTSGNNSKAKTLGEPTVALLERLAMHYALAPELVPRRALRGVEQCRAVLLQHAGAGDERAATPDASAEPESSSAVPSPTILRAIFHLITRDLAEAQPGRTSRLRWYVALVQREHSTAAAKVSARALERWRTVAMRVEQKQS